MVVIDKGNFLKSSIVDVVIYVDDVNDNNLEFSLSLYIFLVDENESNRIFVG